MLCSACVCGVFGFEPVLCRDVWYVMCDVRKESPSRVSLQ